MSRATPRGYISSTGGRKTADTERDEDEEDEDGEEESEHSEDTSDSSVRGYVARSSCGANCAGLTKMESTVWSFSASDDRTVEKTNGIVRPLLTRLAISGMVNGITKQSKAFHRTEKPTLSSASPRLRCPSCNAPIVGTNPTDFPSSNAFCRQLRNPATVVKIGNGAFGRSLLPDDDAIDLNKLARIVPRRSHVKR
jgi:hypothetical protein